MKERKDKMKRNQHH